MLPMGMNRTFKAAVAALMLAVGFAGSVVAEPFEDGVNALERGDYATAMGHLRPLAEKGEANAQYSLGIMYANGDGVPQDYRTAGGRQKVIKNIVAKATRAIAGPFEIATGLLSYWRDETAHGAASNVSEIEAHEAIARLLRFAQFTCDNWGDLIEVP
jgi:TPR repeat protein